LKNNKNTYQNVQIICSTNIGFITYMNYDGNIRNMLTNEDYLNNRVADSTKFIDSIYNFCVVISELN
jgi:hypothetical protein